jgi:hypothetical protein
MDCNKQYIYFLDIIHFLFSLIKFSFIVCRIPRNIRVEFVDITSITNENKEIIG